MKKFELGDELKIIETGFIGVAQAVLESSLVHEKTKYYLGAGEMVTGWVNEEELEFVSRPEPEPPEDFGLSPVMEALEEIKDELAHIETEVGDIKDAVMP
ncbi:MAG: hypothetical protein FWG91_10165 [Lachnospiraceae bacterium]|nr:hypothetical protein [Lachnospiraceae bacterium]